MGLTDLDGFLTGLALGPEQIVPSEWLHERTSLNIAPLLEKRAKETAGEWSTHAMEAVCVNHRFGRSGEHEGFQGA